MVYGYGCKYTQKTGMNKMIIPRICYCDMVALPFCRNGISGLFGAGNIVDAVFFWYRVACFPPCIRGRMIVCLMKES